MVLTRFVSGSYVTLVGSFQEITGGLGWVHKIPDSKVVAIFPSGMQVVAIYRLGSRFMP